MDRFSGSNDEPVRCAACDQEISETELYDRFGDSDEPYPAGVFHLACDRNETLGFRIGDRVRFDWFGTTREGIVHHFWGGDSVTIQCEYAGYNPHVSDLELVERAPTAPTKPAAPQRITIAERLAQCREELERAHERIDSGRVEDGGTVADASLLFALSSLTEVVAQIAEHLEWCENAIKW